MNEDKAIKFLKQSKEQGISQEVAIKTLKEKGVDINALSDYAKSLKSQTTQSKTSVQKAYQEADPFTKSMITSGSMYGSPYDVLPKEQAGEDIETLKSMARGVTAYGSDIAIPAIKSIFSGKSFMDEAKSSEEARQKYQEKYSIASAVPEIAGALAVSPLKTATSIGKSAYGLGQRYAPKIASKITPYLKSGAERIRNLPQSVSGAGKAFFETSPYVAGSQASRVARGEDIDPTTAAFEQSIATLSGFGLGKVGQAIGSKRIGQTVSELEPKRIMDIADNVETTNMMAKGILASKDFAKQVGRKLTDARLLMADKIKGQLEKSFGKDIINIPDILKKADNSFKNLISKEGDRVVFNSDDLIKMFSETSAQKDFISQSINKGMYLKKLISEPNKKSINLKVLNEIKQSLDDKVSGFYNSGDTGSAKVAQEIRDSIGDMLPSDLKGAYKELSNAKRAEELYNFGKKAGGNLDTVKSMDINTPYEKKAFTQGLKENLFNIIDSNEQDINKSVNILKFENIVKGYLGDARGKELMGKITRDSKQYRKLKGLSGLTEQKLGDVSSDFVDAAEELKSSLFGSGAAYLLPSQTLGGILLGGTAGVLGKKKAITNRAMRSARMTDGKRLSSYSKYDIISPLARALTSQITGEQ